MSIITSLIAAGGNSRAARAARAKLQWRDRFGRWIEMGRGVKFKVRRNDGSVISVNGVFSGSTGNPDTGQIHVTKDPSGLPDGFYDVKSSNGQAILASLDPAYLKKQGIQTGKDAQGNPVGERSDADIPNESEMRRSDSPLGWGTWGKRGSFITEDREFVLSPRPANLVAADGNKYTLTRKGQAVGTFKDWPEALAKVDNIDAGGKTPTNTPDAPNPAPTPAPTPEESKRTPDSDFSPAVSDPKERAKNAVAPYDADGNAARLIDSGASSDEVIKALEANEQFSSEKKARDFPPEFPSRRESIANEKMDSRLDAIRNLDRAQPAPTPAPSPAKPTPNSRPKPAPEMRLNGNIVNPDGSRTSVITGKTTPSTPQGRAAAEQWANARKKPRVDTETGGTAPEGFLVPVPDTKTDPDELTAQVVAEFVKQNKADLMAGGKRIVIDFDDKGRAQLSVADTVVTKPEADELALERENAAEVVDLTPTEETPDATEPEVSDPSAEQLGGDDGRPDSGMGDPVGGEVQPEPVPEPEPTGDDGLTPTQRAIIDRVFPTRKPDPAGDDGTPDLDPVEEEYQRLRDEEADDIVRKSEETGTPVPSKTPEEIEAANNARREKARKNIEQDAEESNVPERPTPTPTPEEDAPLEDTEPTLEELEQIEKENSNQKGGDAAAKLREKLAELDNQLSENERKQKEAKDNGDRIAKELKTSKEKAKKPDAVVQAEVDLDISKARAKAAVEALKKINGDDDRLKKTLEMLAASKDVREKRQALEKARKGGKVDPSPVTPTEEETPDGSGEDTGTDVDGGGPAGVSDGVEPGEGEPGLERPEDSDGDPVGDVLGTPVERPARFDALEEQGVKTVQLYEIPSENAKDFRDAIEVVRTSGPFGAAVYVYSEEEYANMRMFMNDDRTAGIAVKPDGDIVSVFVQPGSKDKGGARSMIATAVDQGGTKLDAFDTVLPGLYAKEGFQPTGRVKWDDEYAPENWDAATFAEFNNGKPDVVFMEYSSADLDGEYTPGSGDYLSDDEEDVAPGGDPVTDAERDLIKDVTDTPQPITETETEDVADEPAESQDPEELLPDTPEEVETDDGVTIEQSGRLTRKSGLAASKLVDRDASPQHQLLAEILANSINRNTYLSLAKDRDGKVIGYAEWYDERTNRYRPQVELNNIRVVKSEREKGVGTKLMQDLAQKALEARNQKSVLRVGGIVPEAKGFYARLGAKVEQRHDGGEWDRERTQALADGNPVDLREDWMTPGNGDNTPVDNTDETPVDSETPTETPSDDETEPEVVVPPLIPSDEAEDLKVNEKGDLVEKQPNEYPENQTLQPEDEVEDVTNGAIDDIDESVAANEDPDGPNDDELPVTGGEVIDFGYRDSPEDYAEEKFMPTDEQRDIVMAVLGEKDVAVQALAGTGKTSTLELIARRMQKVFPQKRITYIAFNKSVQIEAEGRMPSNVESRTGDSLAWQGIDKKLTAKRQNTGALIMPSDIADAFNITDVGDIERRDIARGLDKVIKNFAISEDDYIGEKHFQDKDSTEGDLPFTPQMLDWANAMWKDINSPDGQLRFRNDHATKIWALSRPDLSKYGSGAKNPAQVIFFDEAQDINPVMAKVVRDQTIQKVYVGDGRQAIYGFRGAENELDKVSVDVTLPLQKSWRFGPEVAGMGNRFLSMLGSPYKVTGGGQRGEVVEPGTMADADTVITRTNGGALKEIIRELDNGRRVGISKAYRDELQSLVDTATYLQQGGRKPRMNEDLAGYKTWKEVTDDVEQGKADRKVNMLHKLVTENGVSGLQDAVNRTVVPSETAAGDANAPGPLDMSEGGKGVFMPGVNYQVSLSAKGTRIDLVGPKTFMNKDSFKAAGFRFDGQKKSWYLEKPSAVDVQTTANKARGVTGNEATAAPADVTITTAHKSKGLEWDRVRIADDFWGPRTDPDTGEVKMPSPEELRLNYVAVTRAAKALDPGALAWVLDFTDDEDEDPNVPSKGIKMPEPDADLPSDARDLPPVPTPVPAADELPSDPDELNALAKKAANRASMLRGIGGSSSVEADAELNKINERRRELGIPVPSREEVPAPTEPEPAKPVSNEPNPRLDVSGWVPRPEMGEVLEVTDSKGDTYRVGEIVRNTAPNRPNRGADKPMVIVRLNSDGRATITAADGSDTGTPTTIQTTRLARVDASTAQGIIDKDRGRFTAPQDAPETTTDLPTDPAELDALAERLERRADEMRGTPEGNAAEDLLDKVNVQRNRTQPNWDAPEADEVAPEPVAPEPEPEAAPRTFFSDAQEALNRALPAGEERNMIGVEEYESSTNDSMVAAYIKAAGGTPEEILAKNIPLKAKMESLDRLMQYLQDPKNEKRIPKKWPARLAEDAKVADVYLRGPALSSGYITKQQIDTQYEIYGNNDNADRVAKNIQQMKEWPDKPITLKKVKFSPDGELDEQTQAALDATLNAGKTLDTEMTRRLKEKGHDADQLAADAVKVEEMGTALGKNRVINTEWRLKNTERHALMRDLEARKKAYMDAQAAEARALLAEVREMGGGKRPAYGSSGGTGSKSAFDSMEIAHQYYPTGWNDLVSDMFPVVDLLENERGYNQGGKKIALSRTHWKNPNLDDVAIHELGHSMEVAVPGLRNLEWAFHYQRSDKVTDENGVSSLAPSKSLFKGQKLPGEDHGDEQYHNDNWMNKYTGKTYDQGSNNPTNLHWEIFTTGVQSMFGGHYDDYLSEDPEFRQFILGVISAL
jgi:GNAT superfamily N-acetyltransferase